MLRRAVAAVAAQLRRPVHPVGERTERELLEPAPPVPHCAQHGLEPRAEAARDCGAHVVRRGVPPERLPELVGVDPVHVAARDPAARPADDRPHDEPRAREDVEHLLDELRRDLHELGQRRDVAPWPALEEVAGDTAAIATASTSRSAWSAFLLRKRCRVSRSFWWLAASCAPMSTTIQETYVHTRKMGMAPRPA